ncbi:c6 transcription [Diplodia corticola]|uniref:C6 transcription n=1 Tax=Diplodia corticola TaxID=236234 RepID=A0A1J9RM56_9PEZI|nr:c6 transcription [Diplodia corticola]OJD33659.1 c6 transcription [Diplodia corticola]
MSAGWPTPEQDSPIKSPPTSQSRQPQRVLACVLCQQRKIKCNRKFPCSNCIRSKASCVPATLNPHRRKRRFPERELLDRVSKYEDLLRQHNVAFEPLHQQENASPSVEGTSHADEKMAEAAGVEQSSTPKPEQVYEAKNFWHTMSQGFRNPDSDCDSSQDDVREGLVRTAWDTLYTNKDHLLLGSRKTPVDISTLHPDPVQIFRLWQIYLDNVNPLLKVTHAPSLQGRIIEAASNVSRASPALEALMFGIYCVSVQSLAEDDCQTMFGASKEHLLTAHHFGCEQALLNCGFLRTGSRDCLTALFLYLVSVGPKTDPRSLSSMLGVAVRIAQRMNIDSESANARCAPLEAETRRRLWWALVLFDTRIGELANYKSVTLAPTWDCKAPLNVNDSDLWAEMRAPPLPQAQCTDSVFAVVRSELGEYLRHAAVHLDFTTPALKPSANDAETEGGLDGLERRINDKYLRFCDPENPLHYMTIWTARSFLVRYRLVEHNSSHSTSSAQLTEAQRNAALSYALAMLDSDTNIMTSPLTKGYRWLFQFHFPFPAYVHIVQELKRRPGCELADHAWHVMSAHFDSRFSFSPMAAEENPLFDVFAGMVLQAWEPREAALRESQSGQQPVPTPPRIVECFRQKMAERANKVVPDVEQTRNQASDMDMGGLMPTGFGGHGGLLYGMEGQGGFAEMGLGGFSNPGLPGQLPLDMGMNLNQLNWAAMDWGFGNHRGM